MTRVLDQEDLEMIARVAERHGFFQPSDDPMEPTMGRSILERIRGGYPFTVEETASFILRHADSLSDLTDREQEAAARLYGLVTTMPRARLWRLVDAYKRHEASRKHTA
jgi:hypothetical protein